MSDDFKQIGDVTRGLLAGLQQRMVKQHGKHAWESPVRNDPNNTFRTCRKCGIVRITRHEPDNFPPHWQEFERDGAKVNAKPTPACEVVG